MIWDDYVRISEEEFNKAIHTVKPTDVFAGRPLSGALRTLENTKTTYNVDVEFTFTARVHGKVTTHEVWKRIGHDVTLESAQKMHLLIDLASKWDLMFAALYDDWICIRAIFEVEHDDPEEGDTNWFKRHGIPKHVEILEINEAEVTIRKKG